MSLPGPLAQAAAFASDLHVILLATLVGFALAWATSRWRAMYTFLWAGPALLGLLVVLHARMELPGVRDFPIPAGPLDIRSALAAASAVVLVGLWPLRAKARAGAAASAVATFLPLALDAPAGDVLGGALLGATWGAVGVGAGAAFQGLSRSETPGRLRKAWLALTRRADEHLWNNGTVLAGLLALGLAARIPGWWTWSLGPDADRYAAMADAWNHHGEFLLPWGDVYSPGTGPQFSHHFPPLYPLVLSAFYRAFGFSEATTRVASITLAVAAVAVTYACTRNLYGKSRALVAATVVSLSPVLVMTTNKAYAENLLLVLFVLAMWAILKSLEKPWFIVLGGIFAGLGYLTKSSMGYFFVVAGLGGLAWRLHWRGWRVLRDPSYLLAIGCFGGIVVGWAWRNSRIFQSPSTSTHLDAAYVGALAHPWDWARLLPLSFTVMFVLGYLCFMAALPWLPALRRIPRLADEHDSGLWLAILLPLVLTVIIDSALWLYEGDFFLHNVRYVSFVIVPLAWLLMRHVRRSPATWAAIGISVLVLVAGALYYTLPNRPLNTQVADAMGPLVHDGDSLTFIGENDVYRYYFAVTHEGTERDHAVAYQPGLYDDQVLTTTWVLLRGGGDVPGPYSLAGHWESGTGAFHEEYSLWRHS